MLTTRVQWLVLASALLGAQALMQGCSGCGGDKDKPKLDGGDGGGGGDTDGGADEDGGGDGGDDGGPHAGTPGIKLNAPTDLTTSEAGKQVMFSVALSSQPTANVTIPLSVSDPDEGKLGQNSLVFTPDNWNAPQLVTVTGVDDNERDGNVKYTVILGAAVSDDKNYKGLDADDLTLTNVDNDTAGVTVTAAQNLQTSEAGGTATFTIALNTQPSADVNIMLSSSDTTEGTAAPASLTFTSANWQSPQTVTVTGVNDDDVDGNQGYKIVTVASSTDTNYNGIDVADVDVTNVDNDSPTFIVTPLTGLVTNENGDEATFTVKLSTAPTADVTISLSSSDEGEATVSPASLTFTTQNWSGLQTVRVKGVNDDIADGNQVFTIVTGAATSTDTRYAGINPPDVTGANIDNDSPGLTPRVTGQLVTAEDGSQQSTFTIELNSKPSANVTVTLSTTTPAEVSVAPTTVTFTPDNWNSRQTITLSGVDDDEKDGNKPFTVHIATASTDTAYNALDIPNLTGTNIDNDTPGVRVTAAQNLSTRETAPGNQANFTVRLNSKPKSNVVVNVSSGNTAEVTVNVNSLTFTPANWNAPQTVLLTGVNDDIIDGDQSVTITLSDAISADADYNGLSVADVTVINVDDDTAGIKLSRSSGLATSESTAEDDFTVALNAKPTANVTLAVVSSNTAEATVSVASLTFTPDNWNAPQKVTVTGVNDDVQDGPQAFHVDVGPGVSTDSHYSGLAAVRVDGTNADNDTAGLSTIVAGPLTTGEAVSSPQATFQVVLTAQPTADVDVPIASLTPTEGTAAPGSLHFTTANWNAPQTVTVTGANDDIADGTQVYFIRVGPASSTDGNYNGKTVPNVSVSNTDDDSEGITVNPLTALVVGENGDQDSFTVKLNSQPTSNVTIAIASSNTDEAVVSPAALVFTAANWASPQTVLVTGRGDLLQDGDQPFSIHIGPASSSDGKYNAMTVPDLSGTNVDIDSAAIRVTGNNLTTTEAGGQDSFQVVLLNQPTSDVTIPVVSGDTSEGTVAPVSLTFTNANWNAPQVVVVTGANDDVEDGNQPYFVRLGPAVSMDPRYGGRTIPNVRVTTTDDDTAGVTVNPTGGLVTTEAAGLGHSTTFTIVLNSQPTANVVFTLTSSDTAEGTVSPGTVTFTNVNWNAPQTVTVTGVDDFVQDGNAPYLIQIGSPASSDPKYAAQNVPSVTVSNTDNDTAGITVTAGVLTTSEAGGTASFTVELNSQPTGNVVIPVVSAVETEGATSVASLTFTAGNWNVPQTVTLTGQNDFVQDGPQVYAIHLGPAQSSDPNYNNRAIPDLSATNTDNDTAGITVNPLGPLTTTELGVAATFTIKLNSQPTGDVALALSSSDTTEATVSPASVTFTAQNWNLTQTVTVTGVNDAVADHDQPFAIHIGPAVSTDGNYNTVVVPDVNGTNTDDDSAGFVLSKTSVQTFEFDAVDTANDSFAVRLTSEPTADVTISVTSSAVAEATVSVASLTFTALNWNVDQVVTVVGQDDATIDGTKAYTVVLGADTGTTDAEYNGRNPTDVTGSNVEAAYSCDEWLTRHPGLASGQYPLDTDRRGANPVFNAYCDMTTDAGGWTLLAWTADSDVGVKGVPYPGLAYCAALNCTRGSGVPSGSVNALFDHSREFAQAQSTSTSFKATYDLINSYEYAGTYSYASLADLTLDSAAGTCAGVATGTYNDLVGTNTLDGTTVYLNSGLHRDASASVGDFSSDGNSYTWSIGVPGAYCTLSGAPPSSYLGTWSAGQYGPGVQSASGSYSVWVR